MLEISIIVVESIILALGIGFTIKLMIDIFRGRY